MRHSQRLILTLSLILQISLAIGLTGWFSLKRGEQNIEEVSRRLHNELTEKIQLRLSSLLALPQISNQLLLQAVRDKNLNLENRALIESHIVKQIQSFQPIDIIDTISYGDRTGHYIGAGRSPNGKFVFEETIKGDMYIYDIAEKNIRNKVVTIKPNYDPRKRPWYRVVEANKTMSWSPIYVMFSYANLGITLSEPIYDENNTLIAVIGTDVLLKDLSKFLADLKIGEMGRIILVEKTGQIIALSDEHRFPVNGFDDNKRYIRLSLKDISPDLGKKIDLQQIQSSESFKLEEGQSSRWVEISKVDNIQGLDWFLITDISQQEFKDIYEQNYQNTLKNILIVFLISTLLATSINGLIVKPILESIELKQDRLTGLPNREDLLQKIEKAIQKKQAFAIVLLGCDGFKRINSSFSHQIGDKLLTTIAKRLSDCIEHPDYVARLVGDEFVILSLSTQDIDRAIELAESLRNLLIPPFTIDDKKMFLSSRMGIVLSGGQACNPEHLLRDADTAMLKAKKRVVIFIKSLMKVCIIIT